MVITKNKRGFEFSFGWIFAIIVGSAIIFLAIYAVASLVRNEKKILQSEAAKDLGILLNPLETNLESGKATYIKLNQETKIFNNCKEAGAFAAEKHQRCRPGGCRKQNQDGRHG